MIPPVKPWGVGPREATTELGTPGSETPAGRGDNRRGSRATSAESIAIAATIPASAPTRAPERMASLSAAADAEGFHEVRRIEDRLLHFDEDARELNSRAREILGAQLIARVRGRLEIDARVIREIAQHRAQYGNRGRDDDERDALLP